MVSKQIDDPGPYRVAVKPAIALISLLARDQQPVARLAFTVWKGIAEASA